jgi:hypothetical protein
MKKNADPGIDEVRAARMEVSSRYGHNIDRMLADHIKQQQRYADRLITPRHAQLSDVHAYDVLHDRAHSEIAAGKSTRLKSYRAQRKRKTK